MSATARDLVLNAPSRGIWCNVRNTWPGYPNLLRSLGTVASCLCPSPSKTTAVCDISSQFIKLVRAIDLFCSGQGGTPDLGLPKSTFDFCPADLLSPCCSPVCPEAESTRPTCETYHPKCPSSALFNGEFSTRRAGKAGQA
jgi:hypothetical protein